MAESIKMFNEGLQRTAQFAERFDQHMGNASGSIMQMLTALVSHDAVKRLAETAASQSITVKSLRAGFAAMGKDANDLVKSHREMSSEMRELEERIAGRLKLENESREMAEERLNVLRMENNIVRAQLNLKQTISRLHPAELVFYSTIASSVVGSFRAHQQVNHALIEGNSALEERVALTRRVLEGVRLTGTDMQTSVDAARDLVEYGYDLDKSMASTLKLVIQMKDGLGISTKLGAELATVFERQLNVSARGIADSMARVVNDTALAADQAGRMAVNIGRAIALLKPGANRDLSAVVELVGRYEGALQRLGGQFGGFQELLTKMTTPEGLMQAGVLGVNNPAFLESEDATKRVVDSFAAYAKNFLGNTEGWERAMRLQSLSELFGTTTQQVNLMIQAVEEANGQRKTAITLEERFNEQVVASGQTLSRLKNSLVALGQEAAIPLMHAAATLLRPLAEGVQYLTQIPGIVTAASVAFVGGTVLAAQRLYAVTVAFMEVAAAAHIAATQVRAKAAAETASALGTGGAAGTAGRMTTVIRSALAGIGGVIAAGLAGWMVGSYLEKAARRYLTVEGQQSQYSVVELKQSFEESLGNVLRRQAAQGDVAGVQMSIERARIALQKQGNTLGEAERKIALATQGLPEIAGRMRFTKEVSASSMGKTQQEQDVLDVIEKGQSSLIGIAEQQRDVALKQVAIEKEAQRLEEKKQEEEVRERRLNHSVYKFNPFGGYRF